MTNQRFVGYWQKVTQNQCSAAYPDWLEFRSDNMYVGRSLEPGAFMQWDVGRYDIVNSEQVAISTANDAFISYRFAINDQRLSFVDPDGCEFCYQRSDTPR